MAKVKQSLKEPEPDNRLIDERGPTAERLARVPYEVGDTGTIRVLESPIARAASRGRFTERQLGAANKFYSYWYNAHMAGSMGSADPNKIFGDSFSHGRLCATEMAELQYKHFRQAIEAIEQRVDRACWVKEDAVTVLIAIVCEEMTFAEAGCRIGFTGTAAETMARTYLRACLNILIDEWGL